MSLFVSWESGSAQDAKERRELGNRCLKYLGDWDTANLGQDK